MIDHLANFPDDVLAFAFAGHVTKGDYDAVLIPAVEAALERHAKLRLYYETAANLTEFDAGAVWDDFSLGVEHLARWERVAVVTDVDWIGKATQLFSVILPSKVRVFPSSETARARAWIAAAA
jgi:hypothetical protein